jgi:diguanylate cyclase (GGDEF)-like protein
MDDLNQFALALYAVQATAAALLALLFLYYGRLQGHSYLQRWSQAWAALAIYTTLAAITLLLVQSGERASLTRHLASGGSSVALYLGVALLVLGGSEAARREEPAPRTTTALVAAAIVLGVGGTLLTALPGVPRELLLFVRLGLRALIEGAAFAFLAWTIWSMRRGRAMGIRFAAGAFAGYAAVLLALFAVHLFGLVTTEWPMRLLHFAGLVEFLMLMLIAVGLSLWLHEEEHDRLEIAQGDIAHLLSHDGLTGLPNRGTVLELIRTFLGASHGSTGVMVAFLNLDRFRRIGESHDRATADAMLRRVADRLTLVAGAHGAAARVGDDEFVAVLRNVGSRADGARQVAELHRVLTEPVEAEGHLLVCPISVGTAYARDATRDAEALLHEAETAMRVAKEAGGNRVVEYREGLRPAPRDDLDLELDLRGALDAGALRIHLQPVVDARNGQLVGAEALVRWPHPTRGMVPPNAFLPLASRASLIERIDESTLRQALREMSAWRDGPSVAVNLSAASLLRTDLLELVADLCAESKVPPTRLTFEVTEHDVVSDFERGRRRIAALREMGCRIAIDDFGTGYSSLRYLAQLPITGIKVDRSFVERLADDPRAHALVQALVGMAASLQLTVIAEGVEDARQSQALVAMGCANQQGFLFHRPMAPEAFAALLAR